MSCALRTRRSFGYNGYEKAMKRRGDKCFEHSDPSVGTLPPAGVDQVNEINLPAWDSQERDENKFVFFILKTLNRPKHRRGGPGEHSEKVLSSGYVCVLKSWEAELCFRWPHGARGTRSESPRTSDLNLNEGLPRRKPSFLPRI